MSDIVPALRRSRRQVRTELASFRVGDDSAEAHGHASQKAVSGQNTSMCTPSSGLKASPKMAIVVSDF
jgi:hypothetical protein